MRLLIATDAWAPQINGVQRTYQRLKSELEKLGHEPVFLTPQAFRTLPCPTYPEIRLSLLRPRDAEKAILITRPDHVHIATEGPIGLATRAACRRRGLPFTTTYHTRFPEYVSARFPLPISWSYAYMRRFHNAGAAMMVAARSLADELGRRGFAHILPWARGVDTDLFYPRSVRLFGADKPVFLYVGRVAVEKNIEAFLQLDLPGRKVVVGDGPQRAALEARFPDTVFTGPKAGEELAEHYASADVFVFPSLTDTFGVVLIEAMASGLPVAAFPVTGPADVVKPGITGVLDADLRHAALEALKLDGAVCREHALGFSWARSTQNFIDNIRLANPSLNEL